MLPAISAVVAAMKRMLEAFSGFLGRVAFDTSAGRPNTEPAQAVIRVASAAIFLIGAAIYAAISDPHPTTLIPPVGLLAMAGWGMCAAVAVLLHTLSHRKRSQWRLRLAISHDYLFLAAIMVVGGAPMAFGLVFLLWLSIGNGIRFGATALRYSMIGATLSFAVPAFLSPFWAAYPALAATGFAVILIPCLYLRMLLRVATRANEGLDRATRARLQLHTDLDASVLRPLAGLADVAAMVPRGQAPRLSAWFGRMLERMHRSGERIADPLASPEAARSVVTSVAADPAEFLAPVAEVAAAFHRKLLLRSDPRDWEGLVVHPDRLIELHVHCILAVARGDTPGGVLLVEHHLVAREPDAARLVLRIGQVGARVASLDTASDGKLHRRLQHLAAHLGGQAQWVHASTGYVLAVDLDLRSHAVTQRLGLPMLSVAIAGGSAARRAQLAKSLVELEQLVMTDAPSRDDMPDLLVALDEAALTVGEGMARRRVFLASCEDAQRDQRLAAKGVDWLVGDAADPELLGRLLRSAALAIAVQACVSRTIDRNESASAH